MPNPLEDLHRKLRPIALLDGMSDAERELLEMCKPEVTIQYYKSPTGYRSEDNPHGEAAADCELKGWLEHVSDNEEFLQSTYRITPAGADALAKQR